MTTARKTPRKAARQTDGWYIFFLALGVVLVIAAGVIGYRKVTGQSHQLSAQARQLTLDAQAIHQDQVGRVQDQREGCRRGSRSAAADINLNWYYYYVDLKLSMAQAKLSMTTSQLLQQRAAADLLAVKAKTKRRVDLGDAKRVTNQMLTVNGKRISPRLMVERSHFLCNQAYPLPAPINVKRRSHGSRTDTRKH